MNELRSELRKVKEDNEWILKAQEELNTILLEKIHNQEKENNKDAHMVSDSWRVVFGGHYVIIIGLKFIKVLWINEKVCMRIDACISEITRITTPNAPYNDDVLRDTFQLIVTTF